MSPARASGRALLARIESVLRYRGVAEVVLEKGERLCVGSQPVAHVTKSGAVRVHPVLDGVDPRVDVRGLEGYERRPTGDPEQAAVLALDIEVRLLAWAAEEQRGLAARAEVPRAA